MIKLVVNADDLGLNPAIDRGIFRAHREGIVTSATVLVCGSESQRAVQRAKEHGLSLGIHLCLTTRLPTAAPRDRVSTLAPDGLLRPNWGAFLRAFFLGEVQLSEIDREFRAQIQRARDLGAEPDHLDGHQHLHLLPGIRSIVDRISQSEGLPVRWPREMPESSWWFDPTSALKSSLLSILGLVQKRPALSLSAIGVYASGKLLEPRLAAELERIEDGDYELMCHPGEEPGRIPEEPDWQYAWSEELEALCSSRVREIIGKRGIQLTSYKDIFAA